MTRDWGWRQWVVVQVAVTGVLLAAIWLGSWMGRSEVVGYQREACARGQNDSIAAQLTNSDQLALAEALAGLRGLSTKERGRLEAVQERANERIADYATRLPPAIRCDHAFPDPGPFAIPGEGTPPTPRPLTQPLETPPQALVTDGSSTGGR